MYTIVLTLKKNNDNVDKFINISMKSYEKYLDTDLLQEFIVITPNDELEEISKNITSQFPKNKWKWNFYSEDKIVDKSLPSGWAKHQTIKIAISLLIKTEYYLIIHDDTKLVQSFSYKDMFIDDKLIFNNRKIDYPFLFLWNSQILDLDYDKVQYYEKHMNTVPAIFVTKEVKELIKWLSNKYNKWQIYIVNNRFTESTLYWNWLIKNNSVEKYYNIYTFINLYHDSDNKYYFVKK